MITKYRIYEVKDRSGITVLDNTRNDFDSFEEAEGYLIDVLTGTLMPDQFTILTIYSASHG